VTRSVAEKWIVGLLVAGTCAAFGAFIDVQILKAKFGDMDEKLSEVRGDLKAFHGEIDAVKARTLTKQELLDALKRARDEQRREVGG
jgi:hypothetical protein